MLVKRKHIKTKKYTCDRQNQRKEQTRKQTERQTHKQAVSRHTICLPIGNIIHLTSNVLWKFDSTWPNISLPTIVAIVGRMRAPQRIRVAEIGSDRGAVSAGIRCWVLGSEMMQPNNKSNLDHGHILEGFTGSNPPK